MTDDWLLVTGYETQSIVDYIRTSYSNLRAYNLLPTTNHQRPFYGTKKLHRHLPNHSLGDCHLYDAFIAYNIPSIDVDE